VRLRALPALLAVLLIVIGVAVRVTQTGADSPLPERNSYKGSTCGPDAGRPASDLSRDRIRELIFCLHNEQRAGHGLPALRYETRLQTAAQGHAADMVERGFFAHETPEGLGPEERALNAGYPTKQYSSGENLAWGTGSEASPVEVVDGWMHSRGHRENILRDAFTHMGVGVVVGVPEEPGAALSGATYAVSFGGPPLPAGAP
jgi:uncharacterized protein YkwD